MIPKLYEYWRSSASYRLRIAFNLKGVAFQSIPVNLHPDVREHQGAAFAEINPQGRVPALDIDGRTFGQSLAILEWIEETWPAPSLLPDDPLDRLAARAFASTIACDIHPLNNPGVLSELRKSFGADAVSVQNWYAKWIREGFLALEARAAPRSSGFLFADFPTFAEILLVPQVYNARRFDVDLTDMPKLVAVDALCQEIEGFAAAAPEAVKPA